MENNQNQTNELDLPFELSEALVQLCFEFGNEKAVLNVLIKSILEDMQEQGFHVRDPLELFFTEGGREFVAGWAETIGDERLTIVFGVLAQTGERLPKGSFLTDITKAEITSWSNTEEGINYDLEVSGMFVSEEEPTE